ncbi:MAG: hypothetical protein HKN85_00525, partial [Gammaproteobacteria bacterium]|nr:hypothetical protein [Gammaproteobacteria bacterium]
MVKRFVYALCVSWLAACSVVGLAEESQTRAGSDISETAKPIIVIGDIHGDYKQFTSLMRRVGLLDKRNKWIGGKSHFVQMGDIPDRGPDSRKVMDHLMKLEKTAKKAGGAVTVLIGNHEAMMMTDDLRYVHPGEYQSFKDRKSKARRDAYYQRTIEYLTEITP